MFVELGFSFQISLIQQMESVKIRKREVEHSFVNTEKLLLGEQLIILLSSRKEIKYLCNNVSLSLRVCIISDLVLQGALRLENGKVVPKPNNVSEPLLVEALNKIYLSKLTPKELMRALNGEKPIEGMHLKKARSKFYKMLEEKKICKYVTKGLFYNKILVNNLKIKNEVSEYIRGYLIDDKTTDLRADVLILCLNFCGGIDRIIVPMTERDAILASERVNKLVEKYINGTNYVDDTYEIISAMLKAFTNS